MLPEHESRVAFRAAHRRLQLMHELVEICRMRLQGVQGPLLPADRELGDREYLLRPSADAFHALGLIVEWVACDKLINQPQVAP